MDINHIIREMTEYAERHHVPIISQAGASVLTEVVKTKQPLFVLEIGTAIGYSTILIAVHAPEAQIITIELDEERRAAAQDFINRAGLGARITILAGDAGRILDQVEGTFDFLFIDAAKGQYLDYLQKTLDKLAKDAVIAADNVLFRGMVEGNEEVPRRYRTIVKRLRQYLDFVRSDRRFETSVYPNGDGLAISYFKGDAND